MTELLEAHSVEEIIQIAEARPEMVSPELGRILTASVADATARSDWRLVAALQRVGEVLTAMRNPLGGNSRRKYRIIDLLWGTPLSKSFVQLGDQHEWPGWARVLTRDPRLYGGECLSFLSRARDLTVPQDTWLTDCFMQFLADCHDGQPAAAIQWWSISANSGEGSELPYEFAIASLEHIIEKTTPVRDQATQGQLAQTTGKLGQLLYRRRRGDRTENAEQAIGLLRSAADQAAMSGDILSLDPPTIVWGVFPGPISARGVFPGESGVVAPAARLCAACP